MAEGLVNYTRLDDSAEKISIPRVTQCARTMKYGLPMPRKSTAARRSWTPDDARAVHFRGYYKSPQHNASAFDANGFSVPAI